MNTSLKFLILFFFKTQIDCSTKIWRKDPVEPWTSGNNNAPNECMKAVFNKEIEGFLLMDKEQRLHEVILPSDGAIVISSGSKVEFSDVRKCGTNNVYESNLTTPIKRLWFSTKSWITQGEKENVAKPDIYKIPCECDTVEFPNEYLAAVDLEKVDEIVVDKILINNRIDDFEGFLATSIGQRMFLNSEDVHSSQGICSPPKYCGCHNHNRFEKYTDLLCSEESKYCPDPQCLQPIQPKGHCCPICGAILHFEIKDTCEFDMKKMSEVERKMKRFQNGKYINKLNYYAGMVPGKRRDDNLVQLVVAEVGEYTGISIEFINFLTKDENFKEEVYRIKITSGEPYIRSELSIVLIIVLTLIFVLSIYALLYVHYIRTPKYETWIPISRLNVLRKSIAFARFENRHTEDGNDAVDVGIRYEEEDEPVNQSINEINNPLYEREQVTLGNVETEMLQPATSQSKDEKSSSDNDISLVDISLNTIED